MKKMFFLTILFFTSLAFAQTKYDYKHFVVTIKGDTIYGHLKYLTSTGELHNKVIVKNDSVKLTFQASELIYFEEGMSEYYSFIPKGQKETYFMKVWTTGYYELFEWEVPYDISQKEMLIEYRPLLRKKGDADFIDLDHKKWKKQLAELFKDYPELAKDVLKGRYAMDEMNHIIDRYNEWKDDQNDTW